MNGRIEVQRELRFPQPMGIMGVSGIIVPETHRKEVSPMNGLFDTAIQTLARVRANRKYFGSPRPAEPNQPGAVVIWKSRIDMDRWLMMAHTKTATETWRQNESLISNKATPMIELPSTIVLSQNGREESLTERQLSDLKADSRESCRICHQTGVAYIVRGLLINNDIPQKLKARPCWCGNLKPQNNSDFRVPFKLNR